MRKPFADLGMIAVRITGSAPAAVFAIVAMSAAMLLLLAGSPARVHAAAAGVEELAWLEGTWAGVSDGVAMEETWSSPSGGGLVGMHKDSKGGRMVSFEFFRIVPGESTGVCYLAGPLGREPVRFCAIELGAHRVVFENREHDFPQRIAYWLTPDRRLHARVSGRIAGEDRSEEWAWERKRSR
jgi:hypothetical protein